MNHRFQTDLSNANQLVNFSHDHVARHKNKRNNLGLKKSKQLLNKPIKSQPECFKSLNNIGVPASQTIRPDSKLLNRSLLNGTGLTIRSQASDEGSTEGIY